jgi:hypothetical protein
MTRRAVEQLEFRRKLPPVVGNADYLAFETLLIRIEELLRLSGLEEMYIEKCVAAGLREAREAAEKEGRRFRAPSDKAMARYQRICRQALRCNIARQLTEKEYRKFSRRLAEGALLQWFCLIDKLDKVKVPSKSTLERYDKLLPELELRALIDMVNRQAVEEAERLDLAEALKLDMYLSDTTCVESNIHFPTDWVLLRDGVRTLMKTVKVIRKHGLRHRMPDPDNFLREANRLSIEMSQSRRRPDSAKRRKTVLRRMKRLTKLVKEHAERYSRRLQADWRKETDLSEGRMKQIVRRIDGIVEQLPTAIRQAHERIIGGRKVENRDKILSLYERDMHVIVRKKADAEVEFGNTLYLAELAKGLIVDWKLHREISPGDAALLIPSMERMKTVFGKYPSAAGGDRGFASRANHQWLEQEKITDAICPRSPQELVKRMKSTNFRKIQKRRAQTEGRIGIMKNVFLGRPLMSKGFEHRELAVAWAVLAHNLRLLAALPMAGEKTKRKAA